MPAHIILGEVPFLRHRCLFVRIAKPIGSLGPHGDSRDTSLEHQAQRLQVITLHTVLAEGYPRGICDESRCHLAQALQVGSVGHAVDQHHRLVVEKLQELAIVGSKDAWLVATAQLTCLVDAVESWLHCLQRLQLHGFPVMEQLAHLALYNLCIGVEARSQAGHTAQAQRLAGYDADEPAHLTDGTLVAVGITSHATQQGREVGDEVKRAVGEPFGQLLLLLECQVIGIHAFGQRYGRHLEACTQERLAVAQRGLEPGIISVVQQRYARGKTVQQRHLRIGERGTGTRHHIAHACRCHGHDIELSLYEIHAVLTDNLLTCLEESEQMVTLCEYGGVGRIDILRRLCLTGKAAAEAHLAPVEVKEGKHEAVLEAVEHTATVLPQHAHLYEAVLPISGSSERGKRLVARRRIADTEVGQHAFVKLKAPGMQIGLRFAYVLPEEQRGCPDGHEARLALTLQPLLFGVAFLTGQLHAGTAGQPLHRIEKRHLLVLHEETHHIAPGTAHEALEYLARWTDEHGGTRVLMERADANIVDTLLPERDKLAYDINDIIGITYLVKHLIADHGLPPPAALQKVRAGGSRRLPRA